MEESKINTREIHKKIPRAVVVIISEKRRGNLQLSPFCEASPNKI